MYSVLCNTVWLTGEIVGRGFLTQHNAGHTIGYFVVVTALIPERKGRDTEMISEVFSGSG
jgi:hypothetical protein